jgi:hypothetical protein
MGAAPMTEGVSITGARFDDYPQATALTRALNEMQPVGSERKTKAPV